MRTLLETIAISTLVASLSGCGSPDLESPRRPTPQQAESGRVRLVYALAAEVGRDTVVGVVRVIERRLAAFGLTGVRVEPRQSEIYIEVDEERVGRVRQALPERETFGLHLVDDSAATSLFSVTNLPAGLRLEQETMTRVDGSGLSVPYLAAHEGDDGLLKRFAASLGVPDGRRVAIGSHWAGAHTEEEVRTYVIGVEPFVSGVHVNDAQVVVSEDQGPVVLVTFDAEGAEALAEVTGSHVRERLAIVYRDRVMSAPVIMEAITGGRAHVNVGGAGEADAMQRSRDMVIVLRAGALPSPLRFVRQVALPQG